MPYLTLMKEDSPQQEYPLREFFNALRHVILTLTPFFGPLRAGIFCL